MPNDDGGVAKKLAGAKAALESAKNSNVSGKKAASDTPAQKPSAKKGNGILDGLKKAAADQASQGSDIADGLKAKQKNIDEYKAADEDSAMPKMHKGGKVKKDGPHNLEKGEVVVSKDKVKSNKGVVEGLMGDEKEEKDKKKDSPKEEKDEKKDLKKKKKHKMKHTHVEHHEDGTHTSRVTMDDGTEHSSAHADDASMMEAMSQQLGQGAPPQGAAPQDGAPEGAPAQ